MWGRASQIDSGGRLAGRPFPMRGSASSAATRLQEGALAVFAFGDLEGGVPLVFSSGIGAVVGAVILGILCFAAAHRRSKPPVRLTVDVSGRVPSTVVLGCLEHWKGPGQKGSLRSPDLDPAAALDLAAPPARYAYWGDVDLRAVFDHPTRALVCRLVREHGLLVIEGTVTATPPPPGSEAALRADIEQLITALETPTERYPDRLLEIARTDPVELWRSLALYRLLESPEHASTPQGRAAAALAADHERADLALLARLHRWDDDVQAAVLADADGLGLENSVIGRIAAEWPADVAGTVLGRALAVSEGSMQQQATLEALESLAPAVATRELLAILGRLDRHSARAAAGLAALGATVPALGILLPALDGPAGAHHASTIAHLAGSDGLCTLLDELARRDPDARQGSVLSALRSLADPRCEGALLARLPERGEDLERTFLAVLGACGGTDALPVLVGLEEAVTDHFLHIALLDCIAEIQERTGVVGGALAVAAYGRDVGALGLAPTVGAVGVVDSAARPSVAPSTPSSAGDPALAVPASANPGASVVAAAGPRFVAPPLPGAWPDVLDGLVACPWLWLWAEHEVVIQADGPRATLRVVLALPEGHPSDDEAIQAELHATHGFDGTTGDLEAAHATVRFLRRVPRPGPDPDLTDRRVVLERARGREEILRWRREGPASDGLQRTLRDLLDPGAGAPGPGQAP